MQKLLFVLFKGLLSTSVIATPVASMATLTEPTDIAGIVWSDTNGNSIQDLSDKGISNIPISLIGKTTYETVTGNDGAFAFENIEPGSYTLCEDISDSWIQTFPRKSASCPNGSIGYSVEFPHNTTLLEKGFGNFETFFIKGRSFDDANNDSVYTNVTLDPALPGWEIRLTYKDRNTPPHCESGYDAFPAVIIGNACVVVTNANGNYQFQNLGPGTYSVNEIKRRGFLQTYPTETSGLGGENNGTYTIEGESGIDRSNRNFGTFEFWAPPAGAL